MPIEIEAKSQDIRAMLDAVNMEKPTAAALAKYRQWLADNPNAWRLAGDVAEMAESKMLETFAVPVVVKEGTRYGLAAIRKGLGYDNAPMLEQLLIEHIALCWLQLHTTQYVYASVMSGSVSLNVGDYWERRLSMVQARYLRAIEALARVRRLAQSTPLQVNIGGQQVNVVGVS